MNRLFTEIGAAAVVCVILFIGWKMYTKERNERIRFEKNQDSLLSEVVRYKTADSLNVLSTEALMLSNREFKKYNSELLDMVNNLDIKVKRLERASASATTTTTDVRTVIKDSLIYRDNVLVDTLKCVDFNDGWVSVEGCVKDGVFDGLIVSRDTLQQFVVRVPKKFLFFRWGTKSIKQEIVSTNPHTVIDYHKVIEFK